MKPVCVAVAHPLAEPPNRESAIGSLMAGSCAVLLGGVMS